MLYKANPLTEIPRSAASLSETGALAQCSPSRWDCCFPMQASQGRRDVAGLTTVQADVASIFWRSSEADNLAAIATAAAAAAAAA